MTTAAYFFGMAIALIINTLLNMLDRRKESEYYEMVCRELIEINKKENKILEDLIHDNKLLKDQLDAKSSDCIHCPYVTNVRTGSSSWPVLYSEESH